jgi:hypothetical protein
MEECVKCGCIITEIMIQYCTLIEDSDLMCPNCAKSLEIMMPTIMAQREKDMGPEPTFD